VTRPSVGRAGEVVYANEFARPLSRASTVRPDLATVPVRAGPRDPRHRFRPRRHRVPAPPLHPRRANASAERLLGAVRASCSTTSWSSINDRPRPCSASSRATTTIIARTELWAGCSCTSTPRVCRTQPPRSGAVTDAAASSTSISRSRRVRRLSGTQSTQDPLASTAKASRSPAAPRWLMRELELVRAQCGRRERTTCPEPARPHERTWCGAPLLTPSAPTRTWVADFTPAAWPGPQWSATQSRALAPHRQQTDGPW